MKIVSIGFYSCAVFARQRASFATVNYSTRSQTFTHWRFFYELFCGIGYTWQNCLFEWSRMEKVECVCFIRLSYNETKPHQSDQTIRTDFLGISFAPSGATMLSIPWTGPVFLQLFFVVRRSSTTEAHFRGCISRKILIPHNYLCKTFYSWLEILWCGKLNYSTMQIEWSTRGGLEYAQFKG